MRSNYSPNPPEPMWVKLTLFIQLIRHWSFANAVCNPSITHRDLKKMSAIFTAHYSEIMLGAMVFQITGVSIVCSTVCSGEDKKHTSKLRVTDLCEGNPPMTGGFRHKRPVTRKMFPFDDVILWNFKKHFHEWKLRLVNLGLDDGLGPNRRHTTIWTSWDLFRGCNCSWPDLNAFTTPVKDRHGRNGDESDTAVTSR